eukprot:COSAG05_NODE_10743_length_548_cov_1.596882_1_plen_40_part_10
MSFSPKDRTPKGDRSSSKSLQSVGKLASEDGGPNWMRHES